MSRITFAPLICGLLAGAVLGCGGKVVSSGYFFSQAHAIDSVPFGGGPTEPFLSDAVHYLGQPIAFDASNVYFAYYDPVSKFDGGPATSIVWSVHVASMAGGSPRTLEAGLGNVSSIAVDGPSVYYLANPEWDRSGGLPGSLSIHRVRLSDGAVSVLAETPGAAGLAAYGGYLYWTQSSSAGGSVLRMPEEGGPIETLAVGGSPGALAVSATGVSWIDMTHPSPAFGCGLVGGSAIVQLPVGAQTPTVVASNVAGATSIAASGEEVYWTAAGIECSEQPDRAQGGVFKAAPGPGGVEELASGLTVPGQIWVDATSVYVASVTEETSLPLVMGATVVRR